MTAKPPQEGSRAAPSRRFVLGGGLAGLFCMGASGARGAAMLGAERRVHLLNAHTGDAFDEAYWVEGRYSNDALCRINWVLRDHHRDEVTAIDPELIDLLFLLAVRLRARRPFLVMSGYRSRQTNALLRREGYGAAEHSMHVLGKAVDIRPEGTHLGTVWRAAAEMCSGGVGYYPASDFVHLDTGPLRSWRWPVRRFTR